MNETKFSQQVHRCLSLFRKIEEEYPAGMFDREMLHGELDSRYKKLKELRDEINAYSLEVRSFCKMIVNSKCDDEEVKRFFAAILAEPQIFSPLRQLPFAERRKKEMEMAQKTRVKEKTLSHLLFMGRSLGMLKDNYEMKEEYGPLIIAFAIPDPSDLLF